MSGMFEDKKGVPVSPMMPKRTSKVAVTIRWSRRPTPGQPFAKVEKSRCKKRSHEIVGELQRDVNA